MSKGRIRIGFIPLVDCAPYVIAHELGFAAEEGLSFDLHRAPSWSMLRDMLSLGQVDAAHMLAPVPVAQAIGVGGSARFEALAVTSVNGDVIGVSAQMAGRMQRGGYLLGGADAATAGRALIAAGEGEIRFGVPFPFSMHAELLYYWLSALGLHAPQGVRIKTVPPPLMAEAIAAGDIDAFCVGEPWGSIAVENGVGELLLPGAAIWAFAPEKVLATRIGWADEQRDRALRLIRAIWKAGYWLDQPENRMMAAEILSRPTYLDLPSEVIERSLSGNLMANQSAGRIDCPNFIAFHKGTAMFPWKSQAAWIGRQMAARIGLEQSASEVAASDVFRADLFRAALHDESHYLPASDHKDEGSQSAEKTVFLNDSRLKAERDVFFDGHIFSPIRGS